jgi:hypothetical protein
VAYGLWSVSEGWYFLPNSILLKGNLPRASLESAVKMAGYNVLANVGENAHVLLLLLVSLLALLFYLAQSGVAREQIFLNTIFVATTLLHLQFASTGWFFRYEAYLVLSGIVILAVTAADLWPGVMAWRPQLAAILAAPFVFRALESLRVTPRATSNIYQQQVQMGRFLARFYEGRPVAVNDAGAVSFLADVDLVDLWGLGTLETTRWKIGGGYGRQRLQQLAQAREVAVAIVYDHWFDEIGGLPAAWHKVAEWRIVDNVIAGGDVVSFYAVAPGERDRLAANLKAFSSALPPAVSEFGVYAER